MLKLVPIILQIKGVVNTSADFVSEITKMTINYIPKLVGAALVYLIGSFVVNRFAKVFQIALNSRNFDPSLQSFLQSLLRILLNILLLLTVFGMLGINLTSFAAILAGLAVGVGAALNGTLGNFAGGVMMLVFKPFKLGDYVESQGYAGRVIEQGIFNTILLTNENKTVILANGPVSTGTIVNHSAFGNIKLQIPIAIQNPEDIHKAKAVIIDSLSSIDKLLKNPKPEININKIDDAGIELLIGPFCSSENAIEVKSNSIEQIVTALKSAGIPLGNPKPIKHTGYQ